MEHERVILTGPLVGLDDAFDEFEDDAEPADDDEADPSPRFSWLPLHRGGR